MNISQMYGIMLMLMNNGRVTREEVAERFEVSTRTAQRYMDALSEAGVPVESVSGKNGGYSIPADYKLPCVLFGKEDLGRIKVCLSALSQSFKDDLSEDLLDKLTALADGDRSRMPSVEKLVVDFDSWNGGDSVSAKTDAVTTAINNNVTVDIEYTDKSGKTTRRLLDPYSIAVKEGVRYVYGMCHLHNQYRLFRLARIKRIELTDSHFERRSDADVRSALSVELGGKINLTLRVSDAALALVEEWLGSDAVEPDGEEYVARAKAFGGDELIRKLLSFGSLVKVTSPAEVADRVVAETDKIKALYGQKSLEVKG